MIDVDRVRDAWESRDLKALDRALLAAWREVPDPFVASWLTEVTTVLARESSPRQLKQLNKPPQRPHVIPALEAWLREPGRKSGEVIAGRVNQLNEAYTRDPRLSDLAIALMRKSPSPRSIPLDKAVWALLEAQRDPRAVEQLRSVFRSETRLVPDEEHGYADGWAHRVRDGIGEVFNKKVAAFLEKAPASGDWEPRRVDKAVLTELLALRKAFHTEWRLGSGAREAELLEAVCRKYTDDEPRLVMADYLMQQGDERGEYIALAVAKHAKRASKTEAARLKTLWDAYGTRWLAPVAPAIRARKSDMERGFLTRVRLTKSDLATQRAVHGLREWITVREVDLQKPDHLVVLLDEAFRSLRKVHGLSTLGQVQKLAAWHPGLWELSFRPDLKRTQPPKTPAGMKRLRTLSLRPQIRDSVAWFVADLDKPLRVLRLEWVVTDGPESMRNAVSQALTWMRLYRIHAKRTELVFVHERTTLAEVHTRQHKGAWQIATKLRGPLAVQRAVLDQLDKDEVRAVDTALPDLRDTVVPRMFPKARVV